MMTVDGLLNLAATGLLTVLAPPRVHAILKRVGGFLPQRRNLSDVARAAELLGTRGTCLTRSLALAARVPDAAVVIALRRGPEGVLAHAWVEIAGQLPRPSDRLGDEIARLT